MSVTFEVSATFVQAENVPMTAEDLAYGFEHDCRLTRRRSGGQADFRKLAEEAEGRPISLGSLERTTFYSRAKQAFAVIATCEGRP